MVSADLGDLRRSLQTQNSQNRHGPVPPVRKNHHRRLVCTHYSHGDLEGTHSTFRVTILWMPPWEPLPIGLGVEIIHHILWRASLQYTNIDIEWNRKCMQMHHVCSFSKPLKIHIYVGLLWGICFRVDQKNWAPWFSSTWSAGLDAHVPWTPLNWPSMPDSLEGAFPGSPPWAKTSPVPWQKYDHLWHPKIFKGL